MNEQENFVNRPIPLGSHSADANVEHGAEAWSRSSAKRAKEAHYTAIMSEFGAALRRVANTYEADAALQEDLFQEISLALWRALPRFRGEASVRTFVFRIAHNRGLRHGWREGRVPHRLEQPENVVDRVRTPEAEATQSRRMQHLLAAIHTLPLGLRQVITLRLEGLSYREIAEVMGLTENNVMVRASRARSRLKELLSPSSDVSHEP